MSTPATSYTPARTCCNDIKHVIPESIVVIREGLITTFPGCPECLAKWRGCDFEAGSNLF